jgi:hypothetical protein
MSVQHASAHIFRPTVSEWRASVDAGLTQPRSVSVVQPIFGAIEAIAAHCEAWSPPWSSTIRTARRRTSGEYRFEVFFVMAPSSQELEPPVAGLTVTSPLRITNRRQAWDVSLGTGTGLRATNDSLGLDPLSRLVSRTPPPGPTASPTRSAPRQPRARTLRSR